MTRRPFSADEDARLLALLRQGKTYTLIGGLLGRRTSTVRSRLLLLRSRMTDAAPIRKSIAHQDAGAGGRVRCLGGCGQTFLSPDRCRIRVCPVCKKHRSREDVFSTEHALCL